MKFPVAALFVLLPLISQATAASVPRLTLRQERQRGGNGDNDGRGGRGGGRGGNGGNNNNAGAATSVAATAAASATASEAAAATNTAAAGGANNGAADTGDPQTSLTLDPKVIAKGFANNGQDVPADGQVESLTSTNNFINFCLTVSLPITDGKQITTGSCNPAPIGTIPSVDNMPSSKFTFPKNGGNVDADTPFTISMAIKNLETGNFVNAQANYFAAPQQLNAQGTIIGHSHVVVETLTALDQTTPTDPRKFAFFKGLNAAASGGILTADVTAGLPAGAYRLCSINTCANHQPAIVPVAQHGSLDDCIYFTAGAAAAAGGANGAAAGAANGAAAATATGAAAATATQAAATAATSAAEAPPRNGGGGGRGGNNGGRNGGRNNRRSLRRI